MPQQPQQPTRTPDVFDQAEALGDSWDAAAIGGQTTTDSGDSWDRAAAQGTPAAPAKGDVFDQIEAEEAAKAAPAKPAPEPATPTVTRSTNPKLAAAMAQKDASPAAGVAAVLGGTALLAAPAVDSAVAATPATVKAIQAMATAHPVAAAVIKKALVGLAGAEAYKHSKWLLDLLP